MAESILTDVKKALGIAPDDPSFDLDVIMHINSVMMILNELGIGPADGFSIEDDTATWSDFLPTTGTQLMAVKSYITLRVRILFDPPSNSFVQTAIEKQIDELTWRLTNHAEAVSLA